MEDLDSLRLLLSCLCSVGLTSVGVPVLIDQYRRALTGFPRGFTVSQTTAPVMPFWLFFLLSFVLASLLYCVFQLLGTTFRRALGIVAVLMGALAITAVVSRKAGETQIEFLVGREIHEGKNVAVLFSDGYGGLVTREVDLSSHTMLPTVFLIARSESVPVMQVMSLKRDRLR